MLSIIIILLLIIDMVLLIRLNKCGKIINVHEEHTYVPQPKTKKVVKKVEVPDDED